MTTPVAPDHQGGPLAAAWSAYIHARRAKANYADALIRAGIDPDMVATSVVESVTIASRLTRMYNWAVGAPKRDCSPVQREAITGLADAPLSLVTAWLWALTSHPDIWPSDPLQPGIGLIALIPYRRTPRGWLYLAAGIPADEAQAVPADTAHMMAALRHPWIPALTADNQAPLVAG